MNNSPRVVLDTNIYISAIIFGGNPGQILEIARTGEIDLVTSREILLELALKLRDKFLWKENEIEEVIEGIGIFAKIVFPKHKISLIRNDPDNRILECAIEAKVDYIVSGDKKHLLALGKFKGIPIISAKAFLDKYYEKFD